MSAMKPLGPRDLLLAPRLAPGAAAAILEPIGFEDPAAADADLQRIADEPQTRRLLAGVVEELLRCVAASADPDRALSLTERFVRAGVNRVQLLGFLKNAPRTIELLARTFGASPFMAEILIRDPGDFYWLADPSVLEAPRTREERRRDLSQVMLPLRTHEHRLEALRIFKRREILHIGVRDLLRLATVDETLTALSELAEVLIAGALDACQRSLVESLAVGPAEDRGHARNGFAVIGMGKLGGGELNFSSDVDLIYVSVDEARPGEPAAGLSVSLPEFFERLARALTNALSAATPEGSVYRVDLRLRPEGRSGGLVTPLSALGDYYRTRGATWERLALLKAWPVAGDFELARQFLERVQPFVFASGFDARALGDLREMKERIDRAVSQRDQTRTDVKLGLGGIREIELIVQTFELAMGEQNPRLRQRATLPGLAALAEAGLLSPEEHGELAQAYRFLRDVENKLQMVHDVQRHALPAEPRELQRCARRLGYRDSPDGSARDSLMRDYERHTGRVNALFRQLFAAGRPWPARRGIQP